MSLIKLKVSTSSQKYSIIIGSNILNKINEFLKESFINDKIREDVLKNHFSFWLNWDDLVLIKRIKGSKKRPLASKSTEQEIKAIINKRKKIYSKANFKINYNRLTKSEIVKTIIKAYEFN